ncbi:MAG: glycosyltransferase family 4 protein [archaeon]
MKIDKKIAVLATFFWPVSGDVKDYPYNIARALKEEKVKFIIQTPNIWPDGKKIDRPTDDEYKGIKIKRLPVYSNLTWFVKLWFPKVKDYDIIHSCGGYRHPDMLIAFLNKKKGSKFLLSPFYPMHPRNKFVNFLVWLFDMTIGKSLIINCDCCFAETKQEAKWLKKMGAKKIVLLPNSLPKESFQKGDGKKFRKKYGINGKIIFTLGRHVPIKNFEGIIRIMPQIDATLVIGGEETSYTAKCKQIAKEMKVENKVMWAGFMNSAQKRDAYSACDVYICSSIRESLGTSVIEAMAQKKPVISTNSGGLPEIIPDRFCLYDLKNKEELLKKIRIILKDEKFALELGKKGYKKARGFTFEKMKRTYLEALKEV